MESLDLRKIQEAKEVFEVAAEQSPSLTWRSWARILGATVLFLTTTALSIFSMIVLGVALRVEAGNIYFFIVGGVILGTFLTLQIIKKFIPPHVKEQIEAMKRASHGKNRL